MHIGGYMNMSPATLSIFNFYIMLLISIQPTDKTRQWDSAWHQLHNNDKNIKGYQGHPQKLCSVDKAHDLALQWLCLPISWHFRHAPSPGSKKTIFVQYCQRICEKQKTLQQCPQAHSCIPNSCQFKRYSSLHNITVKVTSTPYARIWHSKRQQHTGSRRDMPQNLDGLNLANLICTCKGL